MQRQTQCNLSIDYSKQAGSTLPFKVELDLEKSVLEPEAGENQKFCYTLTGVGEDIPTQKDLSHWVLGICSEITEEDFVADSITVIIDTEPQEVEFGDNVELVSPDHTTGCKGLKFDFDLSKQGGVMQVCFELTSVYPVGDNLVCLKGGTSSQTSLSICGPVCAGPQECETITYQTATVCAPVTVKPVATPGTIRTICCGEPDVKSGKECPSMSLQCQFTVSQKVCIEIPIKFGATTTVGSPSIGCGEPSGEGCGACSL